MSVQPAYASDRDALLSHRHDQGADLWTTPDRRLLKGSPFSTLDCAFMLLELGMEPADPLLAQVAALLLSAWQPDGRFKVYPSGGIYPCQTATVANALCHLGYAEDQRLETTFRHLLETQQGDGGWRCFKFSFGRGPETEFSNPMPTLVALDAFRFHPTLRNAEALSRAIDFLLEHWIIRKPIGPCHYGIGTLFMQVEYPFRSYNLFYYVYVLSFYQHARRDSRFLEALAALQAKLVNGQMVVERVVPKLASLHFCQKGAPSELATERYRDILSNLKLEDIATD
ncbi:MAG TPA: prenyltransferase [Candidatus Limiplasma sp.]|nr:prenyltransferase [Candidatus Limiplasma sp.]HPS81073.1 prenyltransferase [Candidatus Limiplasma sp.]